MQDQNLKEIVVYHDDAKISQAIITLLESNIGYSIDFYGGILCIRQLDDLTFAVTHQRFNVETKRHNFDYEKIFTDARKATEFFLQKRIEYKLGADFEVEISPDKN